MALKPGGAAALHGEEEEAGRGSKEGGEGVGEREEERDRRRRRRRRRKRGWSERTRGEGSSVGAERRGEEGRKGRMLQCADAGAEVEVRVLKEWGR